MRHTLKRAFTFLLIATLPVPAAGAAVRLDLPVRVPGSGRAVPAPAYQGDLLELTLTRPAARAAVGRTAGLARATALGLAGVDRLATAMGGVWFEPEFPAETPPPPDSDQPDFTVFYLAHLPPGVGLADALERFGALSEVRHAGPIACLAVQRTPNDSLFGVSSWYYQPVSRQDIHAPEAWDATIGDTSVVVAILDTGVQADHPDLGGTVAGEPGQIWTNWVEAAGQPGVDDDGNGYVDDVHGWDFVTEAGDALAGEDADIEDNDPSDFAGHGTACAGLVGALTDNTIGVSGMAWKVRLMPLRMGWASNFSPGGEVRMDYAARAIRYATRNGATVLNCSWQSINSNGLDSAVTGAVRAGITVVNAAGNLSPYHYLGDRDDVLSATATDSTDVVAYFSNLGSYVDLAAPGVNLRSTWSVQHAPAYIGALNGTSFSSPLTAGVVALLQSRDALAPRTRRLTPRGVQLRLMETADDISAQNPALGGLYGAGRLNAIRALTETSGSSAFRTRARSVGSPVLIPGNVHPHAAFLASNRRLIELDAVTGDTISSQSTVGSPNGDLAAADLGGGMVGLYCATLEEGVFAFVAGQGPAPGSWPQAGSSPLAMNTPALGDLDGDGTLEVVSGGDDGQLWAWHGDGSVVAGYPVATGFYALQAGPALSDLDGVPGAEVVIAGQDGTVWAFDGAGALVPGWPVTVAPNPRAPVIGRIGSAPGPTVVVAAGNQLYAFSPAGTSRPGFPVTLSGTAIQDPALGDLTGDGHDEIVVATVGPSRIEVRDTLGVSVSSLNWPRPLPFPAQGSPLLGELSVLSPGPELLVSRGGALLALEHDADSLATFPKPGGAGASSSLGQADGDGHAEVVAGTGSDSLFYIYDAGSLSDGAGPMPWPTARGNYARTGSRLYAPSIGSLDEAPPFAIADLAADSIGATFVRLRWSAPADPGPLGSASFYEVRRATFPLGDANFALGTLVPGAPVPAAAGSPESLVVSGLAETTPWYFGIRSRDQTGNTSAMSNLLQATTRGGAPARVNDLRARAQTDSSVSLTWTATGGDGALGRPDRYVVRAATTPLDSASFGDAPLEWIKAATVDAGGSEYLVFPGLAAATRYWFALKALDTEGNLSAISNVLVAQTDVGGPLRGRLGIAIAVLQNPALHAAEIFWQASADGAGSRQSIQLYDVTGRRLRVIDVGGGVGGRVKWDGRDAEGHSVPAGLYYARLLSGSLHAQTRLVLLP